MLSALRRSPASVARPFLARCAPSRHTQALWRAENVATKISSPSSSANLIRTITTSPALKAATAAAEAYREAETESSTSRSTGEQDVAQFQYLSEKNLISPHVIDTVVEDMGLKTMTEVQCLTIPQALKGVDLWVGL